MLPLLQIFFLLQLPPAPQALLALSYRCLELCRASKDQGWCSEQGLPEGSESFRCRLHPDGDFLLALVGAGEGSQSLQHAPPELEAETPWQNSRQHAGFIRPGPCKPTWRHHPLEQGDASRTECSNIVTVFAAQSLPQAQPPPHTPRHDSFFLGQRCSLPPGGI